MSTAFNEMYLGRQIRPPYAQLESWMRAMRADLRRQI
jgi:hypothetical protein